MWAVTKADTIAARLITWEPLVEMLVSTSRGMMNTKPILFWPRSRSDIELQLDRDAGDFLVVDTNSAYELQKLYRLHCDTPIFDPFPERGEYYQDFVEHVVASHCRCHIIGLETCQKVLQTLKDPLLARSPIEEVFAAIKPSSSSSSAGARDVGAEGVSGSLVPFRRWSIIKRSIKLPVDWSYLNWANTGLLAIFVFATALAGNVLFPDNGLLAAGFATVLTAALYVCVRADLSDLLFAMVAQPKRAAEGQFMAASGLMRSWLKK